MRKLILFILFSITTLVYSQSLTDLFPGWTQEDIDTLIQEQGRSNRPEKAGDLKLNPALPQMKEIVETLEDINPNIMAEKLFILPIEAGEEGFLYLLNSLSEVDRLDEIRYLNPTHTAKDGSQGKWHPIFDESYRVQGRNKEKRLPNQTFETRPEVVSALLYQELPPVGPMFSEYRYLSGENFLTVTSKNVTPLKVGILTVISKGNFYSTLIMYQVEGYLVFYGVGGVRVFNPFNVLKGKVEPFYYRIEGLFQWYFDNYLTNLS